MSFKKVGLFTTCMLGWLHCGGTSIAAQDSRGRIDTGQHAAQATKRGESGGSSAGRRRLSVSVVEVDAGRAKREL